MFKRIISILLVMAMFFSFSGFSSSKKETAVDLSSPKAQIAQSVLEYPQTNEDFRYNVYTYYIEITECLSTKSNIIIPDTIQGLPVYKIAQKAFEKQTAITSVTMTNNIIEIGEQAFADCTNLQSINLSKNLELCGEKVFSKCENIKTIVIPGKLKEIPANIFTRCKRLSAVIIEEMNKQESTTVDKDGNVITVARNIANNSFSYCESLKNVWIPKEISEIHKGAFKFSMDNLTIYGQAQSAAAHYASENLIDFVVLDKNAFKDILNKAMTIEEVSAGTTIESSNWKIRLDAIYSIRDSFSYATPVKTEQRNLQPGNEIIVLCFSAKNQTASKQTFDLFDINATVNGYTRKISSFGKIGYPQFSSHTKLLAGEVNSGETIYGYIAVETPSDWKNVSVQFKNDTVLEGYAFTAKSTSKEVVYIGTSTNPSENTDPSLLPNLNPTVPSDPITNVDTSNPTSENTTTISEETSTTISNTETTSATQAPQS